jgi:hypothetical protein
MIHKLSRISHGFGSPAGALAKAGLRRLAKKPVRNVRQAMLEFALSCVSCFVTLLPALAEHVPVPVPF